jgi:type 1 fimbria pilin
MSTRETLPCCRRTNLKGKDQLIIETAAGQRITLLDSPGSILIEDNSGNTIRLESSGITIQASAKVVVNSSQLEISASMITVNAGMAKFSGVVQADTLIANSVIASSYTPGTGNIL